MSVFEVDAYEVFIGSEDGKNWFVASEVSEWFAQTFGVEDERVVSEVVGWSPAQTTSATTARSYDVRVYVKDYATQEMFNLQQNELLLVTCTLRENGVVDSHRLNIGTTGTRLYVKDVYVKGSDNALAARVANVIKLGEVLATREDRRQRVYFA